VTEALEDEFDVVATWTEQVVEELGPQYAVAAACRGSGSPASLAWLAEALEVSSARRMLDAGSGVGGPAAWLAQHFSVTPVCAEPMRGAARASRRLFGLPAVAAAGQALPFPDRAFDAAWCLGVLDTAGDAGDRGALLAELRRVLGDGGRLGLLAFLAAGPLPPPLPEGNEFSLPDELRALLAAPGSGCCRPCRRRPFGTRRWPGGRTPTGSRPCSLSGMPATPAGTPPRNRPPASPG
jgi:SAM-dependent methyltransferase